MREWVTIPEDFDTAAEERLDAGIHILDEAVSISRKVQNFCRERGNGERRDIIRRSRLQNSASESL